MEIDKALIYPDNLEAVTGHERQRDAAHGLVEGKQTPKEPDMFICDQAFRENKKRIAEGVDRIFMDHLHRLNLIGRRLSIARASGRPTSDVLQIIGGI